MPWPELTAERLAGTAPERPWRGTGDTQRQRAAELPRRQRATADEAPQSKRSSGKPPADDPDDVDTWRPPPPEGT